MLARGKRLYKQAGRGCVLELSLLGITKRKLKPFFLRHSMTIIMVDLSGLDLPDDISAAVYSLSETLDNSAFLKGIQEGAVKSNIWISIGIHEIPSSEADQTGENKKRCYNSQCLVTPEGKLASVYRKLHLFDVNFKGSLTISESNTTLRGNELPSVTETSVGKGKLSFSFLILCLSIVSLFANLPPLS